MTELLADRMKRVSGSRTSALIARVAQLRRDGSQIISLNVGEPDCGSPDYVRIAGIEAIVNNFTKYTTGTGILELRQAISKKLKSDNGLDYNNDEICVTVGAKQAVFNAVMALCDTGDEVLIPSPCWVSYTDIVNISGARPVVVPMSAENGYALDVSIIRKHVTDKTKAIIICTPNNPTGAVYGEKSLRELAQLAIDNDFYIISDEIYEKLIYDDEKHFSIACFSDEIKKRTVTINGFSKSYAMTGWRIGYAASCKEIISAMAAIQSQATSAASSISQKAALAAITGPQNDLNAMVKSYITRRDYTLKRIKEIPGLKCRPPKGAFYVLADVSYYLNKSYEGKAVQTSADLADFILEQAKIAVVPGEAFQCEKSLRISYSNSMENLEKAFDGISNALSLLK